MSKTTIEYKGVVTTVEEGESAVIRCEGDKMEDEVVVTAGSGGSIPDGYIKPFGNVTIFENGEFNVAEYETATIRTPIPSLQGTAIPFGNYVKKIYFNTLLNPVEVCEYLSQLTFTQVEGLGETYCPFMYQFDSNTVIGLVIIKVTDKTFPYAFGVISLSANANYTDELIIFDANWGWYSGRMFSVDGTIGSVFVEATSLTSYEGVPIGEENEKIKNVMSITPFAEEVVESGEDSPLPIEVTTASAMNALLSTAEVGSVYKYTGTTGTYENGALYVVEVS